MPRRILLAALLLLAPAGTAHAGWREFWSRVRLDCQRLKCWPEPFFRPDRQAVRAPFLVMMDNGWRLQNTLGDHFFEPGTQELTRAGQLKLRWIITQAPVHRRTVFVLRADTPEDTSIRLDSVQRAAARLVPAGPLPPVVLTETVPREGAGDYYDQIDRNYRSSLPAPKLPERGTETEQ